MTDAEFALELERENTEEARGQRDAAVIAIRDIYRIRGEDPEVAKIANRILDTGWAGLCD